MNRSKWFKFVLACLLASSLALVGCEGDDGSAGPVGPQGPEGPVADTAESCNVCHSEGSIADITAAHPPLAEEPVVSDVVVTRNADDSLTVDFSVSTSAGALTGIGSAPSNGSDLRVYLADIVPAGTVTGNAPQTTWDTAFPEMYASTRGGDAEVTYTDNGDGTYTYDIDPTILTTDFAADAPEGDLATHAQRIYIRADGRDLGFHRTAFVADFMMPAAGNSTAVLADLDTARAIVSGDACSACHNDPLQEAAHGGGYQTPQVCVMCHTPIGTRYGDLMQADEAWSASLFHKIHAEIDMPAFPTRINGGGYSNVTFPREVANCAAVCHYDNTTNDEFDQFETNITQAACKSCHEGIVFDGSAYTGIDGEAGATHNYADNTQCASCHAPGNIFDATAAHNASLTPDPKDVSEFDVAIDMTAPANGTHYVDGEAPLVTVTLTPADGGPAVDYTAGPDTIGDRDGVMYVAELSVYGPRAKAVPVLTAAAAEGGQDNNLLTDSTDPAVQTDATGFKYQLDDVAGLEPGTYMVRFQGGDFGWDSTDYHTSSNAVVTFQVGTATEELKMAGDCTTCHGDTRIHVSGAHPNNAEFDTDACLACHDYSGNYGTPLPQRVHAVHSASGAGADGHGRTWENITFPQDTETCVACHNSGAEDYYAFTGEDDRIFACIGCHGDQDGVTEHAQQNGGDFDLP